METKNNLKKIIAGMTIVLYVLTIAISFASAIVVDADYVTIYPGESGKVTMDIENNENFDMEDISMQIVLVNVLSDGTIVNLPFTVIGSSEEEIDDIDEDDDDRVDFTIKASTEITPGDYNIPYVLKYTNAEDDEEEEKTGTFSIRVSAKTEIDYAVEMRDNAIIGQEGKVSLEVINKGLGDIRAVSVELHPDGFELLSKGKIFIGTINSEDSDTASFDVIYKSTNPSLKTEVTYKDFDNNEHTEIVNLPVKVYTREEALELGLISKNNTGLYVGIIIVLVIIWIVYRKIKKSRKKKKSGR